MTAWVLIIVLWGSKTFDGEKVIQVSPIATQESCDAQAKWLQQRSDISDAFCVQINPAAK